MDSIGIDIDRLKADIRQLSEIGRRSEEDPGLYRMAFTEAEMAAKKWLMKRLHEAGLLARMDGAGNVIGRLDASDTENDSRPAALIGSHLDTVPCAGTLDGSLGVVIGLECLRSLKESRLSLSRPIELIAFADEEGRFGAMFGSEAFCGFIHPARLQSTDLDGITLAHAMRAQGLDPDLAMDAARPRDQIDSYLEVHIEQGPVLDAHHEQVGIVEAITGLTKWQIRFHGEANHAGTTPMDMRKDAFLGLADFAHELDRILDENGGPNSRATIGTAQILPGAANTVPGMVEFSLDIRDTDADTLKELKNAFRKTLAAIARRKGLYFDYEELSHIEPVACNQSVIDLLTEKARQLGLRFRKMPSGAAHDAQMLAQITPTGMIFTPSRGGKSHSPEEWTAWEDMQAAANLALHALASRAA
jgi:N-carbamoyl-L-amino-acid hydrolase